MVNGAQMFGDVVDAATTIDVTTEGSAYGTINPLKETTAGWAMYTGDIDGNGQVQPADFIEWVDQFGQSGYKSGDLNLDGQVQPKDFLLWMENFGIGTQVP
jgi:hypothetical protein